MSGPLSTSALCTYCFFIQRPALDRGVSAPAAIPTEQVNTQLVGRALLLQLILEGDETLFQNVTLRQPERFGQALNSRSLLSGYAQ